MNDEIYMLWLSSLYTLGSRIQNALLERLGGAKPVFDATDDELRLEGICNNRQLETISSGKDVNRLESLVGDLEKKGIAFISRGHANFPPRLAGIPDPPVGLYFMGIMPDPELHHVSLIGSRRCSEYGLITARLLAKALAKRGVVIVSGMARGIDGISHRGSLEGGGPTIAVMGCGVDICYPAEHRTLRDEIILNGSVVSEYPPGVKPLPMFFPARNRIISGLSSHVVVVEASKKSGTLITVDQANDQGRDVMAVPGSILSKLSEGTNQLIRDGASPVLGFEDVLEALGIPPDTGADSANKTKETALAPEEKKVYDVVTFEPVTFDRLRQLSGVTAQSLQYVCVMLELKGLVRKLPGLRFIRTN